MAYINLAMRAGQCDANLATQALAGERLGYPLNVAQSGTPGSCLAVRIVSEVFTLATLGAGVSLLVRNS